MERRLIRINTQYPISNQVETFYHEVCHMIIGLCGLSELDLTEKKEEKLCQVLGMALAQLISGNRKMPKLPKLKPEGEK